MLDGCTPWPDALVRQYRAAGYWEDLTLWGMLLRSTTRAPDAIALSAAGQRVTYSEVVERSEALARQFVALGLRPRDRVVMQLGNTANFVYTFFALMRTGVIPIMALPRHREYEIAHFLRFSAARGYLVPERDGDFDFRAMADEMRATLPGLELVLVDGLAGPDHLALDALLSAEPPRGVTLPEVDPGEVALMLLSGGTTGMPKLIPRTHNDYVYNCKITGAHAGFGPDAVFLAILPLAHNWTLACPGLLGILNHGGTAVLAGDASAEAICAQVEAEGVTHMATGGPLVSRWLGSALPHGRDLSSLRLLMCGGAKMPPELRKRVRERFGCQYLESYGTGEGLINMTRPDDPDDVVLNSSGRPSSPADEIRVIDEQGNPLPDGVAGELVARGPYTIRGYYNAPQKNAEAFTADGFYRMGDVVRLVDGNIYYDGRTKDLVNRGGEKISCEEVENLILGWEQVANVCLVAMPDPVMGEKACAFVIPKPGAEITFADLRRFMQGLRIAKFKWPERLELVDSFPLSPAGKVLRRELRERIAATLAAERGAHAAGAE